MTERPLRVFHLIKGLGRGGAEMLLTDGPQSSDSACFTYGFGYFLPHKNALVAELENQGAKVECFPASSPLAMSRRVFDVARHVRRWRADVVHCHLPLAGVVGRLAGRLAGVPVVYTEHNLIERYHPATRVAVRATWRFQRHVIAVSSEVAKSLRQNLGERIPVTVVQNGVSLERFKPDAKAGVQVRSQLGISSTAPVIGAVAVFRTQKRLDLWLQVARAVLQRRPDTRFLLVGDGPLRDQVERLRQELQLSSALILPGLRADVRPYLACMDAYLMTSDFEGLPIALLEAMASGVVPVTTNAGGIGEVVQHARSGFVHERGDVAGIEASVDKLLGAPAAERRAWALAARQRIADGFSTGRMMREIEQVYLNVTSSR